MLDFLQALSIVIMDLVLFTVYDSLDTVEEEENNGS